MKHVWRGFRHIFTQKIFDYYTCTKNKEYNLYKLEILFRFISIKSSSWGQENTWNKSLKPKGPLRFKEPF